MSGRRARALCGLSAGRDPAVSENVAAANFSETGSVKPFSSLREEAAALEQRLAEIRQQQRTELLVTIVSVVGREAVFSAGELWRHRVISPELAAALDDASISSVRKLGKRLQQFETLGLVERVGQDEHGALWVCR